MESDHQLRILVAAVAESNLVPVPQSAQAQLLSYMALSSKSPAIEESSAPAKSPAVDELSAVKESPAPAKSPDIEGSPVESSPG